MPESKRRQRKILQHRKVLGEAVREFRRSAGFTQERLAEKVDLNPKYLGEVERGEKIISIEALLRIARTLNIPMSEFFKDL